MNISVIIVAGGAGKRMGADVPKQFLIVAGRPVLMHTIDTFHSFCSNIQIIVVLPKEHHNFWRKLCDEYAFSTPHEVVAGGTERFYSVKNGLNLVCNDADIVAVHDGVRPLVSHDTIERVINEALNTGAAAPVMPLVESIRKIDAGKSYAVNRAEYRSVQTPQSFSAELLRAAYELPFSSHFTDDASVVEEYNPQLNIKLVDGNVENIKITTPADMILAEYYLSK